MQLITTAGPVVRLGRWTWLLPVAALAAFVPQSAGAAVPTRTDNVMAVDRHGRPLADNPMLTAGDLVAVTVTGFDPRERVQVRTERGMRTDHADRDGVVHVRFTVAGNVPAGQYNLAVIENPSPTATGSNHPGGPGNVVVTVPRVGILPYRVGDRSLVDVPSPAGPTADASGAQAHRPLASTGFDVLVVVLEAAFSITVGSVLVLRRRRRTTSGVDRQS